MATEELITMLRQTLAIGCLFLVSHEAEPSLNQQPHWLLLGKTTLLVVLSSLIFPLCALDRSCFLRKQNNEEEIIIDKPDLALCSYLRTAKHQPASIH